jgi:uncharacterized protein
MHRRIYSRALISGASRGLGKALVQDCAGRGMSLLLVALPGEGLMELGASIARERGVSVDCLEADLTDEGGLDRLRGLIRARGRPDFLVNNAGVGSVGAFADTAIESHESAIALNALALVRITRIFLDSLEGGGRAGVLNVASLGAFFPMPTLAVYSATKSFVLNYSLALGAELGGAVGVSVLCPNAIRTTDEVKDYVDALGLFGRLACLSPERIAREAVEGALRGKSVIIPGAFNHALAAAGRLVPRSLAMRAINRYWGGFGETPDPATEGLEA